MGAHGASGTRRSVLVAGAHLAVLWTLAVVQPLFELLGRNAEFFVARDSPRGDILVFAFGLTIVPPLAMTLAELAAWRIRPAAQRAVHAVLVALLAAVLALQLLKWLLPDRSEVLLPAAAALGTLGSLAYVRATGVRKVMTALIPAPAICLLLFLVLSPVSELVIPRAPAVEAAAAVRSDVPVVVAVFDELPTLSLMDGRRRIDAGHFPSFARLQRESTWYRNATTVADGTFSAVPPILSGRRPTGGLPTARSYPHNLFTLVGRRYALNVVEPLTQLCAPRLCGRRARPALAERLSSLAEDLLVVQGRLLLPADLGGTLAAVDRDWEDFGGAEHGDDLAVAVPDATPAAAGGRMPIVGDAQFAQRLRRDRRLIDSIGRSRGDRPPLYMVHFVLPHIPWRFVPSGAQYAVGGPGIPGLNDQTWTRDRFLLAQAQQRHLLQLGFADRLLGELMGRLRAAGLWERALVVVVADHGGSVRPGGSRRPVTRDNFPDVGGVPLFVKLPGEPGGRIDDLPASTLDILPTIAKAIGAGPRRRYDGVPLDELPERRTLRIRNGRTDREVSMSSADFVRRRDAQLARALRVFPAGRASRYRIGPNARLIGRRVADLGQGPQAARVMGLDDDAALRRVVPRSGVLPVYVSGQLPSSTGTRRPIAVAVGGRIRAVGRTYGDRGRVRFSVIVPPGSLRRGANDARVFAVDGGELRLIARAR